MLSIIDIIEDTTVDGPGFRTAIYAAGCPNKCPGCHNPESWDIHKGKKVRTEEIVEKVLADEFANVTFSGGDPLHPANREDIARLAEEIRGRYPNKTIWLYTGYDWEQICEFALLKNIDVVVDGEFIEAYKDGSLHWKGSSNQRVIDVQRSLLMGEAVLYEEPDT